MARFNQVERGEDGWSDWQQPIRKGYKMACCDCGLVHSMDFRVYRGRVQMRVMRNERSTGQMRRHMKKELG